jgi:hypothetical protein
MFNWVKNNQSNTNLKEFGSITSHCDKVHVKLCAIFTNKLYPNIMPNDVPPQKEALDLLKIIVPPQKEASKEDVAIKL